MASTIVGNAPAVAETHVSTVFFTGDRAYKLLKPITTSYLDFGTSTLRLQAVDDEIRLNRRMAPDVYLGSADVIENGEVVDRMIVMRRFRTSVVWPRSSRRAQAQGATSKIVSDP